MNLVTLEFLMLQRSPDTIEEIPAPSPTPPDPLIARGLQREQYLGIAILAVSLIAAVGYFSRRFEYALLFAFALSIVLIVFFLTI
ncbi:hypothetical protein I8751_13575 [Nostocaceae cyanobacterium CENA357]|uniref:Uncharacterized protein n=1 Tax=Atlanticothrix silvestris CENA357 TaxID=1725252 RepID=A0A8J7L0X0_9CYAN|nr:hypothetical protein [Atlanticothrix silvestris]MBH8553385.1 hypothetical protein [Atlanticothrix silvestris CENA357]